MRGKYHMMDWELEKWRSTLKRIIDQFEKNIIDEEDLTNCDVCPANIHLALESLGWLQCETDADRWETFWHYRHPNYEFGITLFFGHLIFDMQVLKR